MAKSISVKCPISGHMTKVYETEKDALTFIKFNAEGDGSLKAYYCTVCGGWHVSHNVPDAETIQQVYDMIDKKRELDEASRKEKRELRRLKEKRVQDLIDLYNEINDSPSEDRCGHYVMTMFDCFQVLTRRNATKKALRTTFSSRYGIDIDKEFLNLRKEDVDFKEKIMNLADKMKKAMQGVKVVGKVDMEALHAENAPDDIVKDINERYARISADIKTLEDKISALNKLMEDNEDDIYSLAQRRANLRLQLEYLKKKREIRMKYNDFFLSASERSKKFHFSGIRPGKMDVVHLHVPAIKGKEEIDGIALVKDENHYFIAVDLYPQADQEDNVTTMLDNNPDGTFEGIWPEYVVLKKASKFEERFMRQLADKYADDIDKANTVVELRPSAEERQCEEFSKYITQLDEKLSVYDKANVEKEECEKEIKKLRKELQKVGEERNKYSESRVMKMSKAPLPVKPVSEDDAITLLQRNVAESQSKQVEVKDHEKEEQEHNPCSSDILDFSSDDDASMIYNNDNPPRAITERRLSPPDLTATEKKYPHLAFIRMKRELQNMEYPFIDLELKSWLRFRLMANIARLFEHVGRVKPLTYVLSQEYFDELSHRAKTAYRGMTVESVVPHGELVRGVIVFPNQGYQDTILYDFNNCTSLVITLAYIREGELMFYESFTTQQIIGQPRIDNFMCKSMRDSGTDINRLFNFVKNLVVSFLAMECDMERTMKHFIEDGQAEETVREVKKTDSLNYDFDEDVVIRDANWYSSISIDHMIPVNGYVSHRWMGKGKEKILQEVWVRPHSRNGYHREAGASKV